MHPIMTLLVLVINCREVYMRTCVYNKTFRTPSTTPTYFPWRTRTLWTYHPSVFSKYFFPPIHTTRQLLLILKRLTNTANWISLVNKYSNSRNQGSISPVAWHHSVYIHHLRTCRFCALSCLHKPNTYIPTTPVTNIQMVTTLHQIIYGVSNIFQICLGHSHIW